MKKVKQLTLGSVYETKDGRWRAAITIGYDGQGRQVRRTVSAKTQAECIRRRNELFLELKKSSTRRNEITVETFARDWLGTTAFEEYTPNVYRNAVSKVNNYIIPALGKYRLMDLGAEEVRELDKYAWSAKVSGRTVQIVRSTFSAMMKDAVRRGLLEVNPCERVARPKATSKKRTALSVGQAKDLILHSVKVKDPLASLWASYLFLGPRKTELLGLERGRLHLESAGVADLSWALMTVKWTHSERCGCAEDAPGWSCPTRVHDVAPGFEYRELHGGMILARPKTTSSIRMTPVPEPLASELRAYVRSAPENEFGLMWVSEKGLPIRPERALIRWKAALRSAGLPIVDLHTARHTAASLLAESGVPPQVIGMILGQSHIDTTLRYVHVSDGQARAAMDQLAGMLHLPAGYGQAADEGEGFALEVEGEVL